MDGEDRRQDSRGHSLFHSLSLKRLSDHTDTQMREPLAMSIVAALRAQSKKTGPHNVKQHNHAQASANNGTVPTTGPNNESQ